MLLALGTRIAARSPSLGVQTGVTNVPGPQQALHTLGRKLLASFPFVPVIGNVRISVGIFSYDGALYFGVTADQDSSSDVDVLTGRRREVDGGPARPRPRAEQGEARAALSPAGLNRPPSAGCAHPRRHAGRRARDTAALRCCPEAGAGRGRPSARAPRGRRSPPWVPGSSRRLRGSCRRRHPVR